MKIIKLQIAFVLRGRNQTTVMQYHVFRSAGVCVGVSDNELYQVLSLDQCKFQKHSFPSLEICIYGLSLLLVRLSCKLTGLLSLETWD